MSKTNQRVNLTIPPKTLETYKEYARVNTLKTGSAITSLLIEIEPFIKSIVEANLLVKRDREKAFDSIKTLLGGKAFSALQIPMVLNNDNDRLDKRKIALSAQERDK